MRLGLVRRIYGEPSSNASSELWEEGYIALASSLDSVAKSVLCEKVASHQLIFPNRFSSLTETSGEDDIPAMQARQEAAQCNKINSLGKCFIENQPTRLGRDFLFPETGLWSTFSGLYE